MKSLFIILFSSLTLSASAQTFVDQVDGGFALICSNDSGNWTCEIVSVEQLRELGWADVEGTILIEPTGRYRLVQPTEPVNEK